MYDLLHQYEVDAQLGQLTLRFQRSLAHLRQISRRFTTEYDLRMPADGTSHLVVSQRNRNKYFNAYHRPDGLLTIASMRQDAFFRGIEFDIDVNNHYAAS
jgi:hypothetical protein